MHPGTARIITNSSDMISHPKCRLVRVCLIAGLGVLGLAALALWSIWSRSTIQYDHLAAVAGASSPIALSVETEVQIKSFCGDCHAVPRPESFPRDAWNEAISRGYEYYARSGRNDLDPPPMRLTLDYYRARAPKELVFSAAEEADVPLKTTFTTEAFGLDKAEDLAPAISHLRWTRLEPDGNPVLLACDMRDGSVMAVDVRDRQSPAWLLARANQPCHVEPCDLDQDGLIDLAVADLGSFYPYDHDHGRVLWLRRIAEERTYETFVLASGLGRVADVRPANFDGDGKVDLLVAEFGHYHTGGILLLRNISEPGKRPEFKPERIDSRPGTIHLPIDDFDGDGRADFLALISQEYECVDLFLNQGGANFQRRSLWAAPDLTFGFSGIELVDLDADGDRDVLYTNGDAFDNSYVNPWHGVQWLENRGDLQFTCHRLADMPGAYRALAGDIDNDGDLDIVVVAWLPPQVRPASVSPVTLAAILCLEQTSPGRFVRHTLEEGKPHHATLEMADFDGDGDLDFAVGPHVVSSRLTNVREVPHEVTVWWNRRSESNP